MLEYALYRMKRFREEDESRDCNFPHFRRRDALNYSRWKLYPGALLAMPLRLILLALDATSLAVVIYLVSIGHDYSKGPMGPGCRKNIIWTGYKVVCTLFLWIAGVSTSIVTYDVDYSYYLGPNYRDYYRPICKTSTIVSNHVSWMDAIILLKTHHPAFAADKGMATTPLFATLIWALDSIYIPRGGGKADASSRQEALRIIQERQELIEHEGGYSPIAIFPEGSTSNGTGMTKFKQGAFKSERRVQPILLKYPQNTMVSLAFEVVEMLPLWILQLSGCCYNVEVGVMPEFEPNEYLFDTHADKGNDRWEIYAWAVRDAMRKAGGFEDCQMPHRVKMQYEDYMQMRTGAMHPTEIFAEYQ